MKIEDYSKLDALHLNWIDPIANEMWIHGVSIEADIDYEGEEPGVEYMMATKVIKNLHYFRHKGVDSIVIHMHTCFDGHTKIETESGRKRIKDVKVGDFVLTHKNRYRKVKDTVSRTYCGDMIKLGYGRHCNSQKVSATPEHPILVERDGLKCWVKFEDVEIGDTVFTLSKECPATGEVIPYYRNRKKEKIERTFKRRGNSDCEKHLSEYIIPFCNEKRKEGWIIVPVGGDVTPDAVGFKDGKVVVFEIENTSNRDYPKLKFKKTKYDNHIINDYVDDVVWVIKGKDPEKDELSTNDSWFEEDESGFCKVKIVSKEYYTPRNSTRVVYNLEVEEDNSYLASHVVVHNCGGVWEEGMAIYDTILSMPYTVKIISYTHARSMSSLILQAADKRVMMPNSYFMFHYGDLHVGGDEKSVMSNVKFSKGCTDRMIEIYVDNASRYGDKFEGRDEESIRKTIINTIDKRGDVFLSPEEAIDWGFADEILEDWE